MNELGEAILFDYYESPKDKIVEAAIADAKTKLPPGTTFQIRGMSRSHPDKKNYGIGWYTNDQIRKSTNNFRVRFSEAEEPEDIGCVLIAQLTT